jgi:hypothetical protein
MVIADQSCSFCAIFPVRAGNRVKFVKIKLQDCLKRKIPALLAKPQRLSAKRRNKCRGFDRGNKFAPPQRKRTFHAPL